jgi:hypothetical protein
VIGCGRFSSVADRLAAKLRAVKLYDQMGNDRGSASQCTANRAVKTTWPSYDRLGPQESPRRLNLIPMAGAAEECIEKAGLPGCWTYLQVDIELLARFGDGSPKEKIAVVLHFRRNKKWRLGVHYFSVRFRGPRGGGFRVPVCWGPQCEIGRSGLWSIAQEALGVQPRGFGYGDE